MTRDLETGTVTGIVTEGQGMTETILTENVDAAPVVKELAKAPEMA